MKGKKGPIPNDKPNGQDKTEVKPVEPAVPVLFSEPETVKRRLRVELALAEITEVHGELARVAMQFVEQQQIAATAKEYAKGLQAQQAQLVAKLRAPYKMEEIECRWRILTEENKKELVRLDTNEVVQTEPLSAEDRAAELARVQQQNEKPQPPAA